MRNSFHKTKIYKVVEKKNRLGETRYIVYGADYWIEAMLGWWDQYTKENESLEEAVEQIEFLDKRRCTSEITVYKKHSD